MCTPQGKQCKPPLDIQAKYPEQDHYVPAELYYESKFDTKDSDGTKTEGETSTNQNHYEKDIWTV